MAKKFSELIPTFQKRMTDQFIRENQTDTDTLFGVPYPYTLSGLDTKDAIYYLDTFYINIGLIRMKLIDQARHNVENLIYLLRQLGYVPSSNKKTTAWKSHFPMLPLMVRDIYRATGDKEWLRRMLPDVIKEYEFWTNKKHRTSTGLYQFIQIDKAKLDNAETSKSEPIWLNSPRFDILEHYNPIDLNALLYRNALIIYDLQIEVEGEGKKSLLKESEHIKKLLDLCWNDREEFYFDNNFYTKSQSEVKSLAGFIPLFSKLVEPDRAKKVQKHLSAFVQPGGLTCTDKDYGAPPSPWNYPLCCSPMMYTTIKAMCNYDFMEDAADIGINWLEMVYDIYEQTGELWEWYNVLEKKPDHSSGLSNTPIMGWTMGTYVALVETLGLT
jgi:alpha,alpha-trehalase